MRYARRDIFGPDATDRNSYRIESRPAAAKVEPHKSAHMTPLRVARRVVIGVIGGTLVLFGLVLLFIPGPAFIVIPAGLAILSIEFAWARRWVDKVKRIAAERSIRDGANHDPRKRDPAIARTRDNPESCAAGEVDPSCPGQEYPLP